MPDDPHPSAGTAQALATSAVSFLNGFYGDYLRDQQNGLAIDMAFYDRNRPLPLTREALLRVHPQPTGKLCVFIHGLACHEGVWTFPDPADPTRTTSYGAQLYADRGYSPLYVRYNTGLPIGINGKRLATLLDELLVAYPVAVNNLVLIGHSMGGLVLRSACYYGVEHQMAWVQQVSRIFYLGTPHDGADLERFAHVATTTLQAVPNPITQIIGYFLNQRSQGVKDLRYGTLLAPESTEDAPSSSTQQRQEVPWLAAVEHFLVAGTLTEDPEHVATLLFGDGLVALPRTAEPETPAQGRLPIPSARVRVFPRVHHLKLTRDPDVYQQINSWCANTGQE